MSIFFSLFIYRIGLFFYLIALKTAALFGHEKAAKWLAGRANWRANLSEIQNSKKDKIWFHCASLGEYEMAIPLMQKLKSTNLDLEIVLSFFSPSGYEHCAAAEHFDYKIYLPLDSRSNAKTLIKAIEPKLAVFVKYELWYFYLKELKKQEIPSALINVELKESGIFFRWYGALHRTMLGLFTRIFVSDMHSFKLGGKLPVAGDVRLAGDSRLERVLDLANEKYVLNGIEEFKQDAKVLIAGSSYEKEEQILQEFFERNNKEWKLIIAPHEISKKRLDALLNKFAAAEIIYFSKWKDYSAKEKQAAKLLIIDGIGHLSRLYRFADAAIIGGGFNGALHNAYEALVYNIPVFYAANFGAVNSWQELIDKGLAFELKNSADLESQLQHVLANKAAFKQKNEAFWAPIKISNNLLLDAFLKFLK